MLSRRPSHHTLSSPPAARSPALTRRESPGRKNPSISPVSAKMIAKRTKVPPQRMSPSTSLRRCQSAASVSMGAKALRTARAGQPLRVMARTTSFGAPMTSASASDPLAGIRVVLVEPKDPVNIAAAVRAIANMGAGALTLVRPRVFEPDRIETVAHGTKDIVERIRVCDTLEEAIADCVRVAGYTARRRAAKWTVRDPREEAGAMLDATRDGPVALVFGREDSGLSNEELERAHVVITIPTTERASLNLAQAVLVA